MNSEVVGKYLRGVRWQADVFGNMAACFISSVYTKRALQDRCVNLSTEVWNFFMKKFSAVFGSSSKYRCQPSENIETNI